MLTEFSFRGRTERQAIILWSFETFLIFPNFLRSYVLSHLAIHEATNTYQFIINNHSKYYVSKYYEHYCLQISCSNFRLKLCQWFKSYDNCQTNHIWKGLDWVSSKKSFPEANIHKIFEVNSTFHVK